MNAENQADFRILGETDGLLAVDKPAGLLVHPTKPDGPTTLWDGLRALLGYELATGGQVSIINRLDRETSGVVLVAKSAAAAREAGIAMQRGQFSKNYLALVFGWPDWEEQQVDAAIIRRGEVEESPVWLERKVHPSGDRAVTRFRVRSRYLHADGRRFTLLEASPETGRTHQIRVHAAHLGFPLLGDKIYARGSHLYLEFIAASWNDSLARELWWPRHALHCCRMAWGGLSWESPLPPDFESFLRDSAPDVPR